jgi:NAD(P)-dependent dehydrogenase (short-subunit alcohol dehydrogenase family)
MNTHKQPVAIVTGASSRIGLGLTQALLERGYRVVANSRLISRSKDLKSAEESGRPSCRETMTTGARASEPSALRSPPASPFSTD